MSKVPSPCRNACALDSAQRVCRSCHRTIEEIVAWPRLDDDAKRAVWARLERNAQEQAANGSMR
ncbi:DUF1289 domain-containing protein [Novosphingobium sp. YJ-S2-02]|uniref:DUF1289 domain-containing protein n=1 Tax=Novosphingobium aureum TaxID=2792964 RepID=A0A931H8R2_9SPHN|nr:DUF1289 domain-containing protein [Novosphingobium aureum]MBH0111420.1 DUF1289 domain-containing protein [Novosphingobium aureum]